MRLRGTLRSSISVVLLFAVACKATSAGPVDEPKPTPENTISIQLGDPVPAQKFDHSPKFWIAGVTDRSGNPQPLLVMKARGGVFLDKQPAAIMKDSLEQSLKAANLLAADEASADLVLRVYLFQFGLASGSGLDFFGKVEFSAMVKNPKTGESLEVKAAGTSIANGAMRKKNMQKNVEQDIEAALRDATRNFLRGGQLKEAVAALSKGAEAPHPQGLSENFAQSALQPRDLPRAPQPDSRGSNDWKSRGEEKRTNAYFHGSTDCSDIRDRRGCCTKG